MTLVPLCLILPMIGLSAGGVLHHREHAAAKERGTTSNLPANNHHRPTIPYEGSGHGALGNYVGGITPRPYDGQGEEKLRVIKITRTYAIPYPVPVPLAKAPHHGPAAPWSSTNLGIGNAGVSSGYHGPAGSGYQGSTGSGYHGSAGSGYQGSTGSGYHGSAGRGYQGSIGSGHHGSASSGYHGSTDSSYHGSAGRGYQGSTGSDDHGSASSGYQGSTGSSYHGSSGRGYQGSTGSDDHGSASSGYQGSTDITDNLHGSPLGESDLSHNSLEYTGPSEFFSGYGSESGNHGYSEGDRGYSGGNHGNSGGNHGYSGGNHGYSGGKRGYSGGSPGYSGGSHHSLQDDVYQRHGYSTSKPFRPSQEYTPPELNDHLFSHDNQW